MLYALVKRDSVTGEVMPTDINRVVGPMSEAKAIALAVMCNRALIEHNYGMHFHISPILDI